MGLSAFIETHRAEFAHDIWFQNAMQGHLPPPRPNRQHENRPEVMSEHNQPAGVTLAGMDMVEAIKQGQRQDPAFKEAWWKFCDTYCEGIRDPNRHPAQNLELFLTEHKAGNLVTHGMNGLGPAALTMLVMGMNTQTTVAIVAEYFSHFGTVTCVQLKLDDRGVPTGTCVVVLAPGERMPPVQSVQHEILGNAVGIQVIPNDPNAEHYAAGAAAFGYASKRGYGGRGR